MLRLITVGFLLSLTLFTTGCTTAAVAVIDEKISQMTDKECTSVNIMLGESYCQDKVRQIKQEPVYCYKTLGGVDCYAEKDPYEDGQSERVRDVSELGSKGAEVTYIGQQEGESPLLSWMFGKSEPETAEID
ncbi:MAG: hypothetical protein JJ879_02655 [Sneathiella sp.]|nr:hypothetical protein [Sneathiella sp.]